jgi:hypothetical protein
MKLKLSVLPAAALVMAIGAPGPATAAALSDAPSHVRPMSSCADSGQSGGLVTQATVLARAKVWVDQNIAYTQICKNDPGGYYREDCSGFISMAWELTSSLITTEFNPADNGGNPQFQQISAPALIPGDALVHDDSPNAGDGGEHHIMLFVGWSSDDNGAHRYANVQQESTFGVGTVATSDIDVSGNYWTPIHYVNMVQTGTRVGVVTTDNHALVKEGSLSASWVTEDSGVVQVAVSGDRIGIVTTAGSAYVKEGGLSASWVHELDGVRELALSGNRVGVVTTGGSVYVKEGSLSGSWVHELDGVAHVALTDTRVGAVTTGGSAYVKDGSLSASWVHELDGVEQLALAGNRVGVLTTAAQAYVKEGGLSASWVHELDGAVEVELSGSRVGVVTTGGSVYVKEGSLSASWVHELDGVGHLALTDARVGVITTAHSAYVKEGSLSASWAHEYDGAGQISLS